MGKDEGPALWFLNTLIVVKANVTTPRLAGHGPTLFAGLSKRVDLKLVSRLEFGSGAVAMRYEPRR